MYNLAVMYMQGYEMNITCEELLSYLRDIIVRVDHLYIMDKMYANFKLKNYIGSYFKNALASLVG